MLGPCVDDCAHIDCAATKAQAASLCSVCDKPIGYDVPVYDVRQGEHAPIRGSDYATFAAWHAATISYWSEPHFAHADCLEAAHGL
jgi:hypothetical protein